MYYQVYVCIYIYIDLSLSVVCSFKPVLRQKLLIPPILQPFIFHACLLGLLPSVISLIVAAKFCGPNRQKCSGANRLTGPIRISQSKWGCCSYSMQPPCLFLLAAGTAHCSNPVTLQWLSHPTDFWGRSAQTPSTSDSVPAYPTLVTFTISAASWEIPCQKQSKRFLSKSTT